MVDMVRVFLYNVLECYSSTRMQYSPLSHPDNVQTLTQNECPSTLMSVYVLCYSPGGEYPHYIYQRKPV